MFNRNWGVVKRNERLRGVNRVFLVLFFWFGVNSRLRWLVGCFKFCSF